MYKKLTDKKHIFTIKDITFHLPGGHICGLIGENGAGKSSLIHLLCGLYEADNGEIIIDSCSMTAMEDEARSRLGLVLNESFYDKKMTLEKIGLYYGAMYSQFSMDQYLQLLSRFHLDRKSKYGTLSKGMTTKVQLAFALSHNARCFLFDEPTAGLDKEFREEFLKICAELVADGERSILISSHITGDLDRIADYIGYIQQGKLLFFCAKEYLSDRFLIVTGEDYKCRLINKDAIVYMEKGRYSTSAMVACGRRFPADKELECHVPDIGEFMYYFVKGGREHAEAIAEKFMEVPDQHDNGYCRNDPGLAFARLDHQQG
ncbi:MAG: ABC transporter ATP-binding protein [Ruminococcus sp.]|nr:ABC transporter ATP-binding protein [Ruminococcus sp.]